jgi:hypothetical protein
MRNQRSGAAALVLPLLFVLCSSWLNAQDRHWEILTLFGGDRDTSHAREITYVTTMAHDSKRDRIIIAGHTGEYDLPVTPNALRPVMYDAVDGFIAVFNAEGSELIYCSFIGGDRHDAVLDLTILDDDRLLIALVSNSGDLPTTGTAWMAEVPDNYNAWFATISLDDFNLLDAGYFGGSGIDHVYNKLKLNDGRLVVSGNGDSRDLPTTPDAFQPSMGSGADRFDAFIAIFDSTFNLEFCSYHGGRNAWESAVGGLAETENFIVFAGEVDGDDLPVSDNAYQKTYGGKREWYGGDGYMAAISKDSLRRVYSTYLGGSGFEQIRDVIALENDRVALVGITSSDDFPVTENAWQKTYVDSSGYWAVDVFLAIFDLKQMEFEQITYIGGNRPDRSLSLIPGAEKEEIAVAISSWSYEFPFLPNKSDQIGQRGIILYYDTKSLQPVRGYPLIETGNSRAERMIRTEDGRIFFTGLVSWWEGLIPPPVRSTGFQTQRTSNNDVYIGIFHEPSVSSVADPDPVPGEPGFGVYPQPARDVLRVTIDSPHDATVTLRDLLGRELKRDLITSDGKSATGRIRLSGVRPGMYLLTVQTPTWVKAAKVMVAK